MKPLTLGARLALLNAGVLAVGMAVMGILMFAVVDLTLVRQAEGLLRDEFGEVAVALQKRPLDPEALAEALAEEVGEHKSASLAFRVTAADGELLARSPSPVWDLPVPPASEVNPAVDFRTVIAPRTGERHRILRRSVPTQSFGVVDLEAALRLGAADAARDDLGSVSAVLAPVLLLFALGMGNVISRRMRAAVPTPP